MSLAPPETVGKLQAALHAKAKGAPAFRFYALYDKVCRRDVLSYAYERCRRNAGAPGVDGQTFEAIEADGLGRWLDALMQDLRDRTYRPNPIRRVFIPKPDGKQRPLGIGTFRAHYPFVRTPFGIRDDHASSSPPLWTATARRLCPPRRVSRRHRPSARR
jgi:RNA-directed DNA polymerase